MRKSKSEYSIQTVVNAMRLLEAFRDDEELGVTALSRQLGLHKNNVFRLLATLEQKGYIEQSPDNDRYRLGVRALELGHVFSRSRALVRRARAVLVDLAAASRETAHLAVLQDFEVVHLDGERTDRMVATGLRLGRRLPVHATALGKVLLGCAPDGAREGYDRYLAARGGLEERTGQTIVDRDKLVEHLRGVAVRGFAMDIGECEEGMCCAAAPVLDGDGRVVAALSVSAPAFRVDEDRLLDAVVPQVMHAAERLSRDLGFGA